MEQQPLVENLPAKNYTQPKKKKSVHYETFETAMDKCGFGRYNIAIAIICALAYVAALSNIICTQYILPGYQCNYKVLYDQRAETMAVVYTGVFFGALIFGVSGDVIGRRPVIMFCLGFSAFVTLFNCGARSFASFLMGRFICCMCAGGALPVLWSYFIEFQPMNVRSRLFCLFSVSWGMAFLVSAGLPKMFLQTNYDLNPKSYGFAAWRVTLFMCSILAIAAATLFKFTSESPRFILVAGDSEAALEVLQDIYCMNNKHMSRMPTKLLSDTQSKHINVWMEWDFSWTGLLKNYYLEHLKNVFKSFELYTLCLLSVLGIALYVSCYASLLMMPEVFGLVQGNSTSNIPKHLLAAFPNSTGFCEKSLNPEYYTGGLVILLAITAACICLFLGVSPFFSSKLILYGCLSITTVVTIFLLELSLKTTIFLYALISIPMAAGIVTFWNYTLPIIPTAYRSSICGIIFGLCGLATSLGFALYYYVLIEGYMYLVLIPIITSLVGVVAVRLLPDQVSPSLA